MWLSPYFVPETKFCECAISFALIIDSEMSIIVALLSLGNMKLRIYVTYVFWT